MERLEINDYSTNVWKKAIAKTTDTWRGEGELDLLSFDYRVSSLHADVLPTLSASDNMLHALMPCLYS
jgi:hypothetical protein